MENPNENLVIAFTTQDHVQESLVTGALDNAGIEYVVRSFEDSTFDGLFNREKGHSQILVLEHEKDKANEVISHTLSDNE